MKRKIIALNESIANLPGALEQFIDLSEIKNLPASALIGLTESDDTQIQAQALEMLDQLVKGKLEILSKTTDKDHFDITLIRLKKLTQVSFENETYCSKFVLNNDDYRTLFSNSYKKWDVAHNVVTMLVGKLETIGVISSEIGIVSDDIHNLQKRDEIVKAIKSVCPEMVEDIYKYLIECKESDMTVTNNSKQLHAFFLPLVSQNVYNSFIDLKIKDFFRNLVEAGLADSETGFYISELNHEVLSDICSKEEFSHLNVTALHYEIFKQDQLVFNILNELRNLIQSLSENEEESFLYKMFHSIPVVNTRLDELRLFERELTMMYLKTNISQVVEDTLDGEVRVNNLDSLRENLDTFVMGDVHGHLVGLVTHLYQVGLVDKEGNWIGGEREFIQLGDMVDRWVYSPETLIYLLNLQEQARLAGGDVVILAGNHEISTIEGNQELSDHPYFDVTRDILIDAVKERLIQASHVSNGKIYTHAGIHPKLLENVGSTIGKKNLTMERVAEELNARLVAAVSNDDFNDDIFIIDPLRAIGENDNTFGGIFWNDLKTWEKADQTIISDKQLLYILKNQVVGHTFGSFKDHKAFMEKNDFALITMDFAFSPHYGEEQISGAIVGGKFVLVKDALSTEGNKYWGVKQLFPDNE